MESNEIEVAERAEAALKTNAEAYRLAQEAVDMRTERDEARTENVRLLAAIESAVGALYTYHWNSDPTTKREAWETAVRTLQDAVVPPTTTS